MGTTETTETKQIAEIIRSQIEVGVFMSLGARDLRHGNVAKSREDLSPQPSLIFNATILPMTQAGKRSTAARTMQVIIGLNGQDLYDIRVSYNARGDHSGTKPAVVHYSGADIDVSMLNRTLLALDYDGREVLNPRYA